MPQYAALKSAALLVLCSLYHILPLQTNRWIIGRLTAVSVLCRPFCGLLILITAQSRNPAKAWVQTAL